jgi:hypothetical protein
LFSPFLASDARRSAGEIRLMTTLVSSQWKSHFLNERVGSSGCASIQLRGLECESHMKTGKVRFKGDYGALLLNWIDKKWESEGNNPFRMASHSPWNWTIDIQGYAPLEFDVAYSRYSTVKEMISDTLDAIINAMESCRTPS